ncbi:glucose-6-phosphate dehydrogenase [Candidatus Peregrinibacteria bacterium]|nr:glucose-6-phosphate dehydrogenase [Candidatus Peregrinibacteria bacterium]
MKLKKITRPFHFVIFGASGDLAQLKLFPALYELALQRRLPGSYCICGYARSALSDASFRKLFQESVIKTYGKQTNKKVLEDILQHLYYYQGQYEDPEDYRHLADELKKRQKGKRAETLAYLAVPPDVFKPIIQNLGSLKGRGIGPIRIILEKPFGDNEKSATELFHFTSRFFRMKDVYLLDHYLGKSPVQRILPLRYYNTLLDVLLKGKHIKSIQISALETVGVENRIGYFEKVGIIKDMVQSHLLQILSLFAMAIPYRREDDQVKREKVHILSALRYGDTPCGIVLGQYKGYKKLEGVQKNSKTPTFAAVRFFIDLMDWYRVPIYIRTGKQLNHKHTYIVVEFRKPPFYRKNEQIDCNRLIIELYPNEKIQIRLLDEVGKELGYREIINTASLACTGENYLVEHGKLILDAFLGIRSSFLSFEEIIASWKFVDSLMDCINNHRVPVLNYADGTEGPKEQHELTARDNNQWYDADHSSV